MRSPPRWREAYTEARVDVRGAGGLPLPYATDWGGGGAQAVVMMMVDDVASDDLVVATLDIHDATSGAIIATRDIRRKELRSPMTLQRFTLGANLEGRQGHSMELRVYWHDVSYVKVGSATVNVSTF